MKNTTSGGIRLIKGRGEELGEESAAYLAGLLNRHLEAGEKVLWLVPGGSAIKVAAEAARQLSAPLNNLIVTLTDERYGTPGHPDSNWRQLHEAGMKLTGARLLPILSGEDLQGTAAAYGQILEEQLAEADFKLALAGMGADGHVFGIKPHSPAVSNDSMAAGYKWDDFTRLTATPKIMPLLDELVLYATGAEKHPQIDKLAEQLDVADQPAQALKLVPNVRIYNDYRGGEI